MSDPDGAASFGLSIVLPALNERENLPELVERLGRAAPSIGRFEVVVVDDGSTDGSLDYLHELAKAPTPFSLVLVERTVRNGQLDAALAGARAAHGRYLLFMDADLQHPPEVVPDVWRAIENDRPDVVVASRHAPGGTVERLPLRGLWSRGAIGVARLLLPVSRPLGDPTSGYFAIRRELVVDLRPMRQRCKLLLYALAMHDGLRMVEVPYRFQERSRGSSKLVAGPGFFLRYLREVVTYGKIRPTNRSRFLRLAPGGPASTGRAAPTSAR